MEKERVALVTGGSRGIGRAVAKRLAQEGICVIVGGSTEESAAQTVKEICEAGGKAAACGIRVEEEESVQKAVNSILEEYGHIDILVNNAGIVRDGLLARMSDSDFAAVMQVNLFGAFHCTRAVLRPMMKQRSGRIINISSVSGILGNAGQANYSSSKAGLIGLTKAAARETASRGITVNAVAPGFVDTDMTAGLPKTIRENVTAQIPMKAFGKPEDIANAVAFLASESSGYITGQVLAVDGGMAM